MQQIFIQICVYANIHTRISLFARKQRHGTCSVSSVTNTHTRAPGLIFATHMVMKFSQVIARLICLNHFLFPTLFMNLFVVSVCTCIGFRATHSYVEQITHMIEATNTDTLIVSDSDILFCTFGMAFFCSTWPIMLSNRHR